MSSADVSARVAWADDAPAIAAVQVRAWRASYADLLPAEVLAALDPDQLAAGWRDALGRPGDARHRTLVALERNTVTGFVLTGPATDPAIRGHRAPSTSLRIAPRVARHHVDPDRALPFARAQPRGRVLRTQGIAALAGVAARLPDRAHRVRGTRRAADPPLVSQIEEFADAVPGFVEDLTAGRGPLGFLQDDYQIVDKVQEAVEDQGAGGILGVTNASLAVARGVVSFIVGVVTIAFLTVFMLIEGPRILERFRDSLPEHMKPRFERMGGDIYRTVGGYVGGNLAISLIAGVVSAIVLFALGSSYAIALAVVVALLDLIPLAGATIAAVIVSTVTFIELGWVRGVIVIGFFVLYQQLENHILQPVIYGRTVQLSPLTVLIAILIGAELVGILGALAAIPVAGIIQAIFREVLRWRREAILPAGMEVALPDEPAAET